MKELAYGAFRLEKKTAAISPPATLGLSFKILAFKVLEESDCCGLIGIAVLGTFSRMGSNRAILGTSNRATAGRSPRENAEIKLFRSLDRETTQLLAKVRVMTPYLLG